MLAARLSRANQIASRLHLNSMARRGILQLSAEVREAISTGQPVVALESTIISHGMPYPRNLEVAKEVEAIVRESGAVPATCAIINGVPKVGLSPGELEVLANPQANPGKKVLKASRRDLGYACATGANAATTVSGTMILAHNAGVRVFATGGIGGVHRGAETSMDISADLFELGRTPVAVVCSGVKSILDIGKTLEVLETNGVPVIGYKCEKFPAFFTNDSGFKSPLMVEDAAIIAQMMVDSSAMGLNHGMVISVPNPSPGESAMIQAAIEEALRSAAKEGVKGPAITPYLLAAIERLTKGASLNANIALVKNNARVASEIARRYAEFTIAPTRADFSAIGHTVEYSFDKEELTPAMLAGSPEYFDDDVAGASKHMRPLTEPHVLVFGAAIVDTVATVSKNTKLIPGSSNPGSVDTTFGGVGRNISEALAKMGSKVSLVSAVGDDAVGKGLLEHASDAGIDISRVAVVRRDDEYHGFASYGHVGGGANAPSTASYTAIHDNKGELVAAVADVSILSTVTPATIDSVTGAIRRSRIIVADGNLTQDAFATLLTTSASYDVPVFFEPTSDFKSVLPVVTDKLGMIDVMKPNVSELCAIISACLDKDLIINGRAAVVNALAHRRSKLHLKAGSSEYSLIPPQMNPAEGPMDVQDVKILASALQQLMATGGAKGGAVSGRKGSEWLVDTAEGQARPVVGKHVVVSMGARGVLWCGPGATRDTGAVKSSPLGGGKGDGLDGPADWAHLPAVPLEKGITVTSTNGAGDAFSAGFLHNIVSRATDDDGAALNPKSGGICRDSIQAGLVSAYEAIKKNASKK